MHAYTYRILRAYVYYLRVYTYRLSVLYTQTRILEYTIYRPSLSSMAAAAPLGAAALRKNYCCIHVLKKEEREAQANTVWPHILKL